MALGLRPCPARRFRTLSGSSPGSITMASPVSSSPRMVQLHRRGPTGKVSMIMRVAMLSVMATKRRGTPPARFRLFDLRVEVEQGKGQPMICNHKVGDSFELRGENLSLPAGQT